MAVSPPRRWTLGTPPLDRPAAGPALSSATVALEVQNGGLKCTKHLQSNQLECNLSALSDDDSTAAETPPRRWSVVCTSGFLKMKLDCPVVRDPERIAVNGDSSSQPLLPFEVSPAHPSPWRRDDVCTPLFQST